MSEQEKPKERRRKKETPEVRAAFNLWYESDRDWNKTYQSLSVNISMRTLYAWAKRFEWDARADELDRKAALKAEKEAVERKAKMLQRHATLGRMLQKKAADYFQAEQFQFDKETTALSALAKGIEIEQHAEGLPDYLAEITSASDADLIALRNKLIAEALSSRSGIEGQGD